jgi:hypothetical protein
MPLDHQSSQGDTQRERILARYFNVASLKGDNRQIVKRFLLGALWAAVLTPRHRFTPLAPRNPADHRLA